TEVGAERRMYLPLLALIVLTVVGAYAVWHRLRGRSSSASDSDRRVPRVFGGELVGAVVLFGLTAALVILTVARNREYATPVTLARPVIARRPTAVTHHYLAEQLAEAGLHDEAIPHLR